ncbi:MAG: type II toxin-antitoxin system prevent-host-death family antitoxin [Thermoanaerobaculia bacterium]|nr:MAG: type II toxin-antitoxin system prevent-host-death family antitoxin [Thermoanaerobaculia bacterium]
MKRHSVSEVKNSLSAVLARVRAGATIVIEDRGVPVARIQPLAGSADAEGRAARLVRAGLARPPGATDADPVLRGKLPRLRGRTALSAQLVEERRAGR